MTTYIDYYDLTGDYNKQPETTPGNVNEVKVRRSIVNCVATPLNAAVVGNAIKINAGETVLDIWYRVITAEGTSNAKVDLGFAGGAQGNANGVVTPANSVNHNATFAPIRFAAANYVTLTPQNSVAIDAGVFEVCALIVASGDTL